jgi:hypothetical protein
MEPPALPGVHCCIDFGPIALMRSVEEPPAEPGADRINRLRATPNCKLTAIQLRRYSIGCEGKKADDEEGDGIQRRGDLDQAFVTGAGGAEHER